MGKYYCYYCDVYLAHSSVGGRKAHFAGKKHLMNVVEYWSSVISHNDRVQSIIDQITQYEQGPGPGMGMGMGMGIGMGMDRPFTGPPPSASQFNPGGPNPMRQPGPFMPPPGGNPRFQPYDNQRQPGGPPPSFQPQSQQGRHY